MEQSESIGAKVELETKNELERMAMDESEPGDRKTVSEVVREAVNEYLDKEGAT